METVAPLKLFLNTVSTIDNVVIQKMSDSLNEHGGTMTKNTTPPPPTHTSKFVLGIQ